MSEPVASTVRRSALRTVIRHDDDDRLGRDAAAIVIDASSVVSADMGGLREPGSSAACFDSPGSPPSEDVSGSGAAIGLEDPWGVRRRDMDEDEARAFVWLGGEGR